MNGVLRVGSEQANIISHGLNILLRILLNQDYEVLFEPYPN